MSLWTAVRSSEMFDSGKRLVRKVGRDDISGAAAELAYRFFLALFPFFIFLTALGGFIASNLNVQDPTQEIMQVLGKNLPADARSVLEGELRAVIENHDAGLLSIGIIGALWAASSGIGALMKNLNVVFEVKESRPLWKRYALALSLTLVGAGLLVVAFSLLIAGQVYGLEIADEVGLRGVARDVFPLLPWPAAVLMVLVAVAILYWLAPNTEMPVHWITPGAVVFTIAWLAASFLFGLYVSNFGNYNATYGALGGVVILLVWFYLTSFLLLLGAEINAVFAERQADEPLPAAVKEETTGQQDAQRAADLVRPPSERFRLDRR